jgi:ferredoxin-NADP reductase
MPKFTGVLIGREEIAAETWSFTMGLGGHELEFRPGQTVDVTYPDPPHQDALGNTRTFSLAAAPGRDHLRIAMRVRGGAFKSSLLEASWGTELEIAGPYGSFTLPRRPTTAVLLAGGIGVTPFRAIVEDAILHDRGHSLLLVHSNRAPAETPFLDEFQRWTREHAGFDYRPTMTHAPEGPAAWPGERRMVGPALLADLLPPDRNAPLYYIAGPEGFVRTAERALAALGVDEDRVRVEEFSGYEDGERLARTAVPVIARD